MGPQDTRKTDPEKERGQGMKDKPEQYEPYLDKDEEAALNEIEENQDKLMKKLVKILGKKRAAKLMRGARS